MYGINIKKTCFYGCIFLRTFQSLACSSIPYYSYFNKSTEKITFLPLSSLILKTENNGQKTFQRTRIQSSVGLSLAISDCNFSGFANESSPFHTTSIDGLHLNTNIYILSVPDSLTSAITTKGVNRFPRNLEFLQPWDPSPLISHHVYNRLT